MSDFLKPPTQSEMIRDTHSVVKRIEVEIFGNGKKGLLARMNTAEMKIHVIYAIPAVVVGLWAILEAMKK